MDDKKMRETANRYKNLIVPPFDTIMDMDGFDAICAFSRNYSGNHVYIPSLRSIFRACIEQEILIQAKNKNVSELARTYGYSDRHIRNLLRNQ